MRRSATLLIVAALLACREVPEPVERVGTARPGIDDAENGNLLNMAFGPSVVSRTGELTLDNSALRAIDGDPASTWTSPPADNDQTIVFAFPAPVRIEQVGAKTPPTRSFAVAKARFEVSADGKTFTTIAEPQFKFSEDPQLFPVAPVTASYLRVTTTEAPGRFAMLQSVHVRGKYETPPAAKSIAGCWTIKDKPAYFTEEGGRVRGAIGELILQGGVDGALYRLVWTRGPEWGHAAITVAPDGKTLSGIKWHEEPIEYNYGESWFGEQCSSGGQAPPPVPRDISLDFLQRAGRLPIYGGDADLDVVMLLLSEGKRVRLVARDFRGVPVQSKLDALRDAMKKRGADLSRVEFVALGDRKPHHPIQNELMRSLYGVVEIEP